jgi:hypothetical protein
MSCKGSEGQVRVERVATHGHTHTERAVHMERIPHDNTASGTGSINRNEVNTPMMVQNAIPVSPPRGTSNSNNNNARQSRSGYAQLTPTSPH